MSSYSSINNDGGGIGHDTNTNNMAWLNARLESFKFTIVLVFILALLFKIRSPLQFYVKFGLYIVITILYAILVIPFSLLRPVNSKNIDVVAKHLTWLYKIYQIKFTIENSKYLQINQPYILINNHQSSLDFMTMMAIWPGNNCTPLAKKELLYSGPFGLAIWLCGITFIDRLNPEKARGTITDLADKINKENMRVWIFPEGTRSPKTELLPFKKGAFHLAIQAQIPIVCVVTSSYLNFYSKKEKKFLPGEVKVKVLPPFQTRGMKIDQVGQLAKHLQETMQKEFDLLNKEINLDEKYYQNNNSNNTKNGDIQASNHEVNKTVNGTINRSSSFLANDELPSLDSLNNTTNKSLLNDDNNNSINNEEDSKKKL